MSKYCKKCNKELTKELFRDLSTYYRAKYCSRTCYYEDHKLVMETRTCEACKKPFVVQSSKKKRTCSDACAYSLNKRIGNRYINAHGYVVVKSHGPFADANGFEYEHRKVMAEHLGRALKRWETVHHKDGNKQNNNLDNLELLDNTVHTSRHQQQAAKIREAIRQCKCPACGYSYELYY